MRNKNGYSFSRVPIAVVALLLLLVSGCASTPTQDNADPLEPMNRVFYDFNDALDKYFFKPVAEVYVDYTPQPVRTSVTNFFENLSYLNVILNDLLQGKFRQGVDDTARLFVNSTIGLGGFFDPATSAGLVRHNEDLGQTFG